MSMKFIFLFFLICCLFSNSFSNPFNLKTGMTEDEILGTVNGKLLSDNHSLWRAPMIIQELNFINRDNLRLVQVNYSGKEYCLAIELDHRKTLKNLFYISLNDTWPECRATFIGDYWKVFNQVKVGDDYDDVIKRIGQNSSSDFYCDSGVWYIRYYYRFENQRGLVTFFAATGKVAHVVYVTPGYTSYRLIKCEDGELDFYID